jgi:hypothetical protein
MICRNVVRVVAIVFSVNCFGGINSNVFTNNESYRITHLINTTLRTLHVNGNIDIRVFPSNFPEIIREKWNGIVRRPGFMRPECTLGDLFIMFARTQSDEKHDYEYIEKSDFKGISQDLAYVLIKLAR